MIISNISSTRLASCIATLFALGCAFGLAIVQSPSLKADDTAALRPVADKAPNLPVTATFEKAADADRAPYVLKLKNDSQDALKVSAKVLLSVAFHMESKARNIPEHVIDPGQVWTISELAAGDKVIVTAKDFAPLELTVH